MIPNNIIGRKYEAVACAFLKEKGYKILRQNYANKLGEIDIICKHNETIVFVEVKYRTSNKFGRPIEAITYSKLKKIRLTATAFLKENGWLNKNCRFDAIEILNDEIRHIENIM